MLKHILAGQPSTTGSRHHQGDYQSGSTHHHHHAMHPDRDVYDSVGPHPSQRGERTTPHLNHLYQLTSSSAQGHRHPLNHSQLSVNNLSQRMNHNHVLNLSTLSTSKHSVNSASPVVGHQHNNNNNSNSNNNNNNVSILSGPLLTQVQQHQTQQQQQQLDRPKANGGLDISKLSRLPSQATPSPTPVGSQAPAAVVALPGPTLVPLNASWSSTASRNAGRGEPGLKETLTSLGLLCLVSLLLALLSLIFLLKISPLTINTVNPSSFISHEEYTIVYEVTLALCALALSLNLCCLLVCAIQFLFTVKLVKFPYHGQRTNKYLQKSSISRVCAVGGFFISIPVFLTGMILYTFIQFHSTPAIVTSVFIGLGIVFCGCAMVHNVFVWQREKTNAIKALAREQCEAAAQLHRQQQLHLQRQQQHQQHQQQSAQQQARGHHSSFHSACTPKLSGLVAGNPNVTLSTHGRGSQLTHHQPQPQHMHHSAHRHLGMSPSLLLSSPLMNSAHNHLNISTHRSDTTPPLTPGDRSPPSPLVGKHNRSQQMSRETTTGSVSPGIPPATLDLSSAANTNSPHELSTLV